tara:strand:- start:212 stop:781 length:570 start_codon:yes stop_codon:yes gene_type:complete
MKNLILLIAFLTFSTQTITAQDDTPQDDTSLRYTTGEWFIGGSFTTHNEDVAGVKSSMSEIAPKFGIFVSETWSIGFSFNLMSNNTPEKDMSSTSFGLAARNYFMELGDKTNIYLETGIDFTTGDPKTSTILGATFGLNHHISNKITLDFTLAPLMQYVNSDDESSFDFHLGNINNIWSSATLGIQFKL